MHGRTPQQINTLACNINEFKRAFSGFAQRMQEFDQELARIERNENHALPDNVVQEFKTYRKKLFGDEQKVLTQDLTSGLKFTGIPDVKNIKDITKDVEEKDCLAAVQEITTLLSDEKTITSYLNAMQQATNYYQMFNQLVNFKSMQLLTGNSELAKYAIEPVQYAPRIRLLLADINKKIPSDSLDPNFTKQQESISGKLTKLNDNFKKKHDDDMKHCGPIESFFYQDWIGTEVEKAQVEKAKPSENHKDAFAAIESKAEQNLLRYQLQRKDEITKEIEQLNKQLEHPTSPTFDKEMAIHYLQLLSQNCATSYLSSKKESTKEDDDHDNYAEINYRRGMAILFTLKEIQTTQDITKIIASLETLKENDHINMAKGTLSRLRMKRTVRTNIENLIAYCQHFQPKAVHPVAVSVSTPTAGSVSHDEKNEGASPKIASTSSLDSHSSLYDSPLLSSSSPSPSPRSMTSSPANSDHDHLTPKAQEKKKEMDDADLFQLKITELMLEKQKLEEQLQDLQHKNQQLTEKETETLKAQHAAENDKAKALEAQHAAEEAQAQAIAAQKAVEASLASEQKEHQTTKEKFAQEQSAHVQTHQQLVTEQQEHKKAEEERDKVTDQNHQLTDELTTTQHQLEEEKAQHVQTKAERQLANNLLSGLQARVKTEQENRTATWKYVGAAALIIVGLGAIATGVGIGVGLGALALGLSTLYTALVATGVAVSGTTAVAGSSYYVHKHRQADAEREENVTRAIEAIAQVDKTKYGKLFAATNTSRPSSPVSADNSLSSPTTQGPRSSFVQ